MLRKIRSALVLLCTLGVATMGALAQTSPPPTSGPPNAAQRLDRLAVLLDLTDAQKAQVKAVLDAQHAKMKAQFEADRASGTRPTFPRTRRPTSTGSSRSWVLAPRSSSPTSKARSPRRRSANAVP